MTYASEKCLKMLQMKSIEHILELNQVVIILLFSALSYLVCVSLYGVVCTSGVLCISGVVCTSSALKDCVLKVLSFQFVLRGCTHHSCVWLSV